MADEHFFPAGDFPSGLGAAPFFNSGPYAPAPPQLDVAACAAAMAPFGMVLPPWAAELHLPHADSSAAGHFDSALSSLVSSPAHASGAGDDAAAIGDLIGRLGSICNNSTVASASNSCYSTPLSSPPRGGGASSPAATAAAMAFRGYHPGVQAPPPLETASSKPLGAAAAETAETTSTKAAAAGEAATPAKGAARKRKGKASSSATTAAAANGSPKRPKVAGDDKCGEDAAAGDATTEEKKKPEPEKDYIHVRARRGQATDSHSLAERVRREKISERMKLLQSLVPGCNKITGKALMLDEIINYVQSLQRQVEFLSMKLATMNPELEEVDAPQYLPSDKDMMMHHQTVAATMLGYDLSYGSGDPFAVPPATMESCTSTAFHPGWAQDLQSIVHHEMTNGHDQQQQQQQLSSPAQSHRHAFLHHGGQQQQQQTASHMKVEQ